jgi:hypothetical protein
MSTMTELKHGYVEDNETASGLGEIPAVIRSAAVAAGIKDPTTLTGINAGLIKLDGHGHVTNPRELVEDLHHRRPALFHKRANEMDQAEYEAARRRLAGIGRAAHLT